MTISQADIDALLASASDLDNEEAKPAAPASRPTPGRVESPVRAPGRGGGAATAPISVPGELRRILRMRVPVLVNLAERDVSLHSVLRWTPGSIIEFDKPADSDLRLVIANKPIGSGHAVKVGENFGLRVTMIGDVTDRILAMGGA